VDQLADCRVDRVVGAMTAQELRERFEGVPGDGLAFVDR
jgi:hypothetical protein